MSQHIYSGSAPPQNETTKSPDTSSSSKSVSSVHLTTHNQYKTPRLLRENLDSDPLKQFNKWFQTALNPESDEPIVKEPEAMSISTVSKEGIPSSRFVLLKTVDERGFVFFTNYNSRKSIELSLNPFASIAIYWKEVSKSIRVIGRVEKVSRQESVEYFKTRPRGSQIGAWASRQSSIVEDGHVASKVDEYEEKFKDQVECPEHWGGWRVIPFEVEFWSGQPSRLHDRFRYTRPKEGESKEWTIDRLAP